MTSSSLSVNAIFTAIVPYAPPSPLATRSKVEINTSKVFRHVFSGSISRNSLEVAKFEKRYLCPLPLELQTVRDARSRRLHHVLPTLTGQYPNIGHKNFVIEGPHQKIGIDIFAPTRNSSGNKLRMQIAPGQFLTSALSPEQIQTLRTHSLDSLNPIGKTPFLIFSHGLGVNPADYRSLLEELASHGYVVVSLNHPSSSGYAPFSQNSFDFDAYYEERYDDRLASIQADNIRFAVDYIRKKEGNETPIVLAGHSLGGAASIIAARNDPKIRGCINLDGALRGNKKSEGLNTPLLMIFSDHLKNATPEEQEWIAKEYVPMLKDWSALNENSKNSRVGQIKGTSHMDFSMGPLLNWLVGEKTLEGALKAHDVASREMVGFMHDVCDA